MRARRLEHIGMVHHLILYNKNTFYITKMAEILTTMATNNGKLQLQHQQQQQLLQLQQHQEQEQEQELQQQQQQELQQQQHRQKQQ